MSIELNIFITQIEKVKNQLIFYRELAFELGSDAVTLNAFDKIMSLLPILEKKAKEKDVKVNYLNQFKFNLDNLISVLPFLKGIEDPLFIPDENWKTQTKLDIKHSSLNILSVYEQLEFNIDFFNKIGYFNNNIVAIGANGSGKTSLSNKFNVFFLYNGIIISAQKILLVPNFDSITDPEKTALELKQIQIRDKRNKLDSEFNYLQKEFEIVLKNLLADNISVGNSYRIKAFESKESGKPIENPEPTNLDTTLKIWNNLIEHRIISCDNGINIVAKTSTGISYPAMQMSDGEKVMLYLIAQVLQAPKNGFIVVDEPEMYLHKTILKRLWDLLEAERADCIFIYLTHDLDFATSRTTAKKIWIKSFTYPDKWEIENIPSDEIPETLMFELLGSRKDILFCEGNKGSIDERIYSHLFLELTIIPVGSCFDVINHTKAFNKLKNVNTKAFGLIDSDHQDISRLEKLKEAKIYSFNVAEVENLFLDEDFLKIFAKQFFVDEIKVEFIKSDVIKELDKQKEIQASNYVSTKVNYYFTDSDVSKGNDLSKLTSNYQDFINKVDINDWYTKRISELAQMVADSNYNEILKSFNNKGLQSIANKHLNISDFIDRSIKLLQSNDEAKIVLNKYFPKEIKTTGKMN